MDNLIDNYMSKDEQLSLLELNRKMKYGNYTSSNSKQSKSLLDELAKLTEIETNDGQMFDLSLDRISRVERYNAVKTVIHEHNLLQKALNAYKTNIFLKHALTTNQSSFIINNNGYVYDDVQTVIHGIMKYFELEKLIKEKITYPLLITGDVFVELVDLSDLSMNTNNNQNSSVNVLHEVGQSTVLFEIPDNTISIKDKVDRMLQEADNFEHSTSITDTFNVLFESKGESKLFDKESLDEFITEEDLINKIDFSNLKNIHIEQHDAENVVIIEHYGQLLGYVIIDKYSNDVSSKTLKAMNTVEFLNRKVEEIVSSFAVMKNIKDNTFANSIMSNKNLKIALYKHMISNKNTRVRIVSPEKIIRFNLDIDKYAPYGTSVLDNSIVPANNELLSSSATLIGKIARTPILRNWNMEIGRRKGEAKYVEKLTNNMANRNITYDDIFNVKTKSRLIKSFEDVISITKDGKRYLDLEQIEYPKMPDTTNIDNNLKQQTIESLNVPKMFLGIDGNDQLREEIVASNINFAKEIDTMQTLLENGLFKIINKIIEIAFNKTNDFKQCNIGKFVSITLNHPVILKLQAYEQIMNSVSNVQQTLQGSGINIDPIVFYKQELPFIEWDNLLEESIISKVRQKLLGMNVGEEQNGMDTQDKANPTLQYNPELIRKQFDAFNELIKLRSQLIEHKRFADSVVLIQFIKEIPNLTSENIEEQVEMILKFIQLGDNNEIR